MTFVKINGKPATKSFNNLMDDLFAGMPSIIRDDLVSPGFNQQVPVNIREREKNLSLISLQPALKKMILKFNWTKMSYQFLWK